MQKVLSGLLMVGWLAGCSSAATVKDPAVAGTPKSEKTAQVAADPTTKEPRPDTGERDIASSGTWIGASGASDFVLTGTSETFLGVWVDVPSNIKKIQAPAAVSVVIDTSGSMAGPKMEHARAAAKSLIDKLPDGDIVSLISFDDSAQERVPPTTLDSSSRQQIRRAITELAPSGSTNMFDGLRQGETRAMMAPSTHAIRRVVLISDGIANIGPSTPELLGELAERGAERGVQVTAVGVGLDYDESTLNALAIRSSGRLHHLAETRELPIILEKEMALLKATAVTNAVVEVIPAPGVQLLGADGVQSQWVTGGGLRVPLGTLFGGQHREMLMRVRVSATTDGTKPLASVRLHFTDPSEGNLPRVQEIVARYTATADTKQLELHANSRTQGIMAVQEAGRLAVQAAQSVNMGSFDKADKDLAVAETKLRETAKNIRDEKEKQRVEAAATRMATARKSTAAAAAAPAAAKPAAKRAQALDLNASGMREMGY